MSLVFFRARPADYSNFGQSRSGYDMTTYTYDNSHQNQGQGNEQMYQMYTTPNDYYGNKDVMEAADRKRRAHDDTAAISAKRTFTNDYDGYTLPTEYVRAWGPWLAQWRASVRDVVPSFSQHWAWTVSCCVCVKMTSPFCAPLLASA